MLPKEGDDKDVEQNKTEGEAENDQEGQDERPFEPFSFLFELGNK